MKTGKKVALEDGNWDIEDTGSRSTPGHNRERLSCTDKRFIQSQAIALLWRLGWSCKHVSIATGLHPGTISRKFALFRRIKKEGENVDAF